MEHKSNVRYYTKVTLCNIEVYDSNNNQLIHTLKGHTGEVRCVVISSDNKYVISGSNDNTIRIWDIITGECMHTLNGHTNWVNCVVISSDNKYIISGAGSYDNTIRIWDIITGECIHTLKGHTWINCVAISSDNKYVISGSHDKTIRIWDIITGECMHTLNGHTNWVNCVVISSDNKYIISGSRDKTIRIWDIITGECIHNILHDESVTEVAICDDFYVSKGDSYLKIWYLSNCIRTFSTTSIEYKTNINQILNDIKDNYCINLFSSMEQQVKENFRKQLESTNDLKNQLNNYIKQMNKQLNEQKMQFEQQMNNSPHSLLVKAADALYDNASYIINNDNKKKENNNNNASLTDTIPSKWLNIINELNVLKSNELLKYTLTELPNNIDTLISNYQQKSDEWYQMNILISSSSSNMNMKKYKRIIKKRNKIYKELYTSIKDIQSILMKSVSSPSKLKQILHNHNILMNIVNSFSLFNSSSYDNNTYVNTNSNIEEMIANNINNIKHHFQSAEDKLVEYKLNKVEALKNVRINARELSNACVLFVENVKLSVDELHNNLQLSLNEVNECETNEEKARAELIDDNELCILTSSNMNLIYDILSHRKLCLEKIQEYWKPITSFMNEIEIFTTNNTVPSHYLSDEMKSICTKHQQDGKLLRKRLRRAEFELKEAKEDEADDIEEKNHEYKIALAAHTQYHKQLNRNIESIILKASRFAPELLSDEFGTVNKWAKDFIESYKSGTLKKIGMHIALFDLEPMHLASNHAIFKGRLNDSNDNEISYVFKEFQAADIKKLMREVRILSSFDHPYIVDVLAVVPSKLKIYIQMPYYKCGNLSDWLIKHNNSVSFNKRRVLARQLVNAIECVHNAGIIHCDIKPQNIFMESDNHLRLGDFDVSMVNNERATYMMTNTITNANIKGFTLAYAAPELLENQTATIATDIYSLGIVFAILLYPNIMKQVENNDNNQSRLNIMELVESEVESDNNEYDTNSNDVELLVDLLSNMLHDDPNERLTAKDIELHSFFSNSELSLVNEDDKRKGNKYTCNICYEEYYELYGIMCPMNKHFLCGSCFSDHIIHSSTTIEGRQQRNGNVYCVMHTVKNDECYQLLDKPYSEALIGKKASLDAFKAYMKCRKDIMEEKVAKQADAELKVRVVNELEILRQLSEEERTIRQCRIYITENILNLKCPNPNGCNQVFIDFSGCFALSCSKCNTQFCGWCLEWCNNDAHPHVRECEYRLSEDLLFGSKEEFNQSHCERRQIAVQQYLSTLDDELAIKVQDAIWQDLRDLQII